MKGVVACEKLLDWKRLWHELSQEETWEETLQGGQAKGDEDEENVALHVKKGRDMRKVKCTF